MESFRVRKFSIRRLLMWKASMRCRRFQLTRSRSTETSSLIYSRFSGTLAQFNYTFNCKVQPTSKIFLEFIRAFKKLATRLRFSTQASVFSPRPTQASARLPGSISNQFCNFHLISGRLRLCFSEWSQRERNFQNFPKPESFNQKNLKSSKALNCNFSQKRLRHRKQLNDFVQSQRAVFLVHDGEAKKRRWNLQNKHKQSRNSIATQTRSKTKSSYETL